MENMSGLLNDVVRLCGAAAGMARRISKAEVMLHNKPEDAWLIIHGNVYEVTKWAAEHPGGPELLWDVAGKDATRDFEDAAHSDAASAQLVSLYCSCTLIVAHILGALASSPARPRNTLHNLHLQLRLSQQRRQPLRS